MRWQKFNRFMTGNDDPWSLDFKEFFSRSFRKRPKGTTEEPKSPEGFPKPWRWTRVFVFSLITAIIYYLIVMNSGIFLAFPWAALVAASVIPVTVMVLLYECVSEDHPRLVDLAVVFLVGTAGSLMAFISLDIPLFFEVLQVVVGAPIIEEIAKAIAIYVAIVFLKVRRVSVAILIGWVIGSGFQIAETLGYATFFGYQSLFMGQVLPTIVDDYAMVFRSLFAFGSHALFGAMEGAGILFSRAVPEGSKTKSSRFFLWLAMAVVLHMLWNVNAFFNGENRTVLTIVSVVFELGVIPIFLYLLDAGLRDGNRHRRERETVVKDHDIGEIESSSADKKTVGFGESVPDSKGENPES